jgi:hypothetical protein
VTTIVGGSAGRGSEGNQFFPAWLALRCGQVDEPQRDHAWWALGRGRLLRLQVHRGRVDAAVASSDQGVTMLGLTVPVVQPTLWEQVDRTLRRGRPWGAAEANALLSPPASGAAPAWLCACARTAWRGPCLHAITADVALMLVALRAPGLLLALYGAEPSWWRRVRCLVAPWWPGVANEDMWLAAAAATTAQASPGGDHTPQALGLPPPWRLPWEGTALASPQLDPVDWPRRTAPAPWRADSFWLGATEDAAPAVVPGDPSGSGTAASLPPPEASGAVPAPGENLQTLLERTQRLAPPTRWWDRAAVGPGLAALYQGLDAALHAEEGETTADRPGPAAPLPPTSGFTAQELEAWRRQRAGDAAAPAASAPARPVPAARAGVVQAPRPPRAEAATPPSPVSPRDSRPAPRNAGVTRRGRNGAPPVGCLRCGSAVRPAWRFCAGCGAPLSPGSA